MRLNEALAVAGVACFSARVLLLFFYCKNDGRRRDYRLRAGEKGTRLSITAAIDNVSAG